VTDAAVTTLGALAAQLPWVQYEQLLNQWLKVMKKTGTKVSCCQMLCMAFQHRYYTMLSCGQKHNDCMA